MTHDELYDLLELEYPELLTQTETLFLNHGMIFKKDVIDYLSQEEIDNLNILNFITYYSEYKHF
jgi:hypothetical protein